MEPDFSGYATRNGLKCSDGRTIIAGAFKHSDKMKVPLVWQHQYETPENILGHAVLENRNDGVYAYGYFNETEAAQSAKAGVEHGDITALSIYANNLTQQGKNVMHGDIREVSLVISGANPGALIDNVNLRHGDTVEILDDEAVIYTGLELEHSSGEGEEKVVETVTETEGRTVKEIFDSLTEEQKQVVYYMVGEAMKDSDNKNSSEDPSKDKDEEDDDEDKKSAQHSEGKNHSITHSQEGNSMTRNVFDQNNQNAPKASLSHSQLKTIVEDAQKNGSFKEAFLQHAVEYGIENIDLLFPDAKALSNTPELIGRRTEWVNSVISAAHKSPFSRIKTLSADITHDEARAKGYVKGNLKKEEWFALAKRVTTPTTIYKKQKLDRDDIIDITDLDVVAWLKGEMRLMLDEEIARAVLIGDGREVDDEDKINETMIRPIARDDDFYTHKVVIPAAVTGDGLVEAILRARPTYRGSGTPTFYCTENLLTDLLLLKDKMGRRLYATQGELEAALRVAKIVSVDVLESESVNGGELLGVLVNMRDYTMGADKGGNVSMFDDFDIDYNQYKYLIEGRMSGALTKFKSAQAFTRAAGVKVSPEVPGFNASTGVVTIPSQTGVLYQNKQTGAVLAAGNQSAISKGDNVEIEAVPNTGHYFESNTVTSWVFQRELA